MCTSLYLAALKAAVAMGDSLSEETHNIVRFPSNALIGFSFCLTESTSFRMQIGASCVVPIRE
jgi:hypothetical protein